MEWGYVGLKGSEVNRCLKWGRPSVSVNIQEVV